MQFQRNNAKNIVCKAIGCGLIPIVCCILYCAFQGQTLRRIYLPNTVCSDDIYYYKMVEGMVEYGYPLGYFGYNESHAMVSSFGVWSPVLLLPWTLWGKVFGWGYFSPILCNICILSISFIIFAVFAKPTWKQIISIAFLFLLVTPFTRYVLSGMPETIGYALIIIMFGVVYSYFRHESASKLIWIFLLISILSLMRPYFMVFLLLPGILWMRRSRLGGILGTALMVFLNLLGYGLITHFFAAPYFYSSMAIDFIDSVKNGGFTAGCLFLLHKIYDKWIIIRWNMALGVRQGFTDGQIYFACCIAMLLLFVWLLSDLIKAKRQDGIQDKNLVRNIVLESSLLFCFVIMLFAIIVLYQIPEGSRHILVFLIGFIIGGAMRDDNSLKKTLLVMAAFVYLFVIKHDDASGYRVPYSEGSVIWEVENLSDIFHSCISLNYSNVPNYDNVVDWVMGDIVDGEEKEIPWRVLFALPEGIGISCCLPQYMKGNIDELNSRYIITVSNGQIDLLCQEKEMDVLLRNECFVLYKAY